MLGSADTGSTTAARAAAATSGASRSRPGWAVTRNTRFGLPPNSRSSVASARLDGACGSLNPRS